MAISIKGGTPAAAPRAMGLEGNAAAAAHARLSKKGGVTSKRAADLVGDVLDELVRDDAALGPELEAARKMLDEVCGELPEGPAMARDEAIAEKLKQKVEATRGQRQSLAGKIKQAFEELDE